ncbi:MFS transporter [Streptomyces sp. CBMA156]|uniref:MFS transporter n=1 Tax=Streptomyces sp. CBMA156 TaxID=1930280 RepID=UPI001E08D1AD|nr:MFS transporter [Streptomyces sp. CBMA156]MBD0675233.1 MFS transporter [Streptomyces sp. CBMA156]
MTDSPWGPARVALTSIFAVDGFLFAAWVVRIPDIRSQVSASHSALGLALLCLSIGAVLTMPMVGRLCLRYGSRPVTVGSLALLSVAVLLPAHAHSVSTLGAVLLLFGAGYGGANVAMNSVAVELVAQLRRPVMPSFHAGYSFGGLLGTGVCGLLAGSLSTAWALALSGVLGMAVTVGAGAVLLRSPAAAPVAPAAPGRTDRTADQSGRAGADAGPARSRTRLLVVLLGLTALCTAYGEGAIADWTTLHLTDDVHASSVVAATGYGAYAFAMATGRVSGTWLSIRLGQTRLMLLGGLTAAVGMLVAALAPAVPVAICGFVLVGLGLANLFPLSIARAGAAGGPQGVAFASSLGYGGMLIGPVVIGFLADAAGLPLALTTVAVAATLAALLPLSVGRRLGVE